MVAQTQKLIIMKKINLRKSSELTSQNSHRVVMVYELIDGTNYAVGNVFVAKNSKVPKSILESELSKYQNEIEFVCMYDDKN